MTSPHTETDPMKDEGFSMTESSELSAALAAFQAELPRVIARETGRVTGENKQGKAYSYEYSYADLAEVSQAALPLLGRHGLAFTAWPTVDRDRFVLRYMLLHKSGERIEGLYPIKGGNPQATGSEITYARRYCLCAVTGISPDQDDDAAAATQAKQTEFPTEPTELDVAKQRVLAAWNFQYGEFVQAEVEKDYAAWSGGGNLLAADPGELRKYAAYLSNLPKEDAGSDPGPPPMAVGGSSGHAEGTPLMSSRQRGMLFKLMGEIGLDDKGSQLTWINKMLGTEYESRTSITFADAKTLIDGLQKGIDAPSEPA